jgi:hypothetical protein
MKVDFTRWALRQHQLYVPAGSSIAVKVFVQRGCSTGNILIELSEISISHLLVATCFEITMKVHFIDAVKSLDFFL